MGEAKRSHNLSFDEVRVRAAMSVWLPRLSPLIEAMAVRIDAHTIALTAATFIVARSFPRRHLANRASDFGPVVQLLAEALDDLSADNLVSRVNGLADAMSAEPGLMRHRNGRPIRPISAASKFIWTARPCLGIIYDARARTCLMRSGLLHRSDGYDAYVRVVREELPRHADFIEKLLPHADPALGAPPWLRGKIFDFCLYAHGSTRN